MQSTNLSRTTSGRLATIGILQWRRRRVSAFESYHADAAGDRGYWGKGDARSL
jgi:hypothetical protein